jgi:hypothetical protein
MSFEPDFDYLWRMMVVMGLTLGMLIVMLMTSCATVEPPRERPLVTIFAAQNGSLWRKQSSQVTGMALEDGMLCLKPAEMERLISACSEPADRSSR